LSLTQKHIHALCESSKCKRNWLFNFGDDILISALVTRLKPENIMKLKHYMHNLLSIYQTQYCKTTFLALIPLSYIILNRPVVEKQHYYIINCNKPIVITELQLNLQNHIHVCCCSFNKIFIKRKYCAPKQVWPKDKFWPNNKFWLFLPNNLEFPDGMSVKFGLWAFHEL